MTAALLAAAADQDPQDVGTAGPIGLALTVVLLVAVLLLGRSMGGHLKKVPRSFEPAEEQIVVPDTPAELFEPRRPGADLLDHLRRAPLAIEGPRTDPEGTEDRR